MGLKYSSADSQNLMTAMKNNLELANQVTDRLSTGCEHLITALESGELKGAAYTAGKGLFTEVIIPTIEKLQSAIDDIQAELRSYEYADSTISEYGELDLDNMEQQLEIKLEQLDKVESQLTSNYHFFSQIGALFTGNLGELLAENSALEEIKTHLQVGIDDLEERIEKLKWFHSDVAEYFSDSLTVLQLAIEGALALGNITVDEAGNYYTNGTNMEWLTRLAGEEIHTTDRGTDPKLSLINQNIRDLMLTDEAGEYYRQQLIAILDGRPANDWPLIIQAYNQSLLFDDEGNLINIFPVNVGAGDGYIVLKNGEYDISYTNQLNQEHNSQVWQTVGDNAGKILMGLVSVVGGAIIGLGSTAVGFGGLVLALPTGGTITVPTTAIATTGVVTSGTLLTVGTVTLVDALSQIAVANATLQISFVNGYNDLPTSRTVRDGMTGRVNGKKLKNIRVDIEPNSGNSGKIQVQSGSGKQGYDLNLSMEVSDINSKQDIINWVSRQRELKNLKPGELQKIIDAMWKGYQRLSN